MDAGTRWANHPSAWRRHFSLILANSPLRRSSRRSCWTGAFARSRHAGRMTSPNAFGNTACRFRFAIASSAVRGAILQRTFAVHSKAAPPVQHQKAMPGSELPVFLRQLEAYDGEVATRLALKLIILTMVRTKELRGAEWREFEDLGGDAPLWRIPASRMKMPREHLVPR